MYLVYARRDSKEQDVTVKPQFQRRAGHVAQSRGMSGRKSSDNRQLRGEESRNRQGLKGCKVWRKKEKGNANCAKNRIVAVESSNHVPESTKPYEASRTPTFPVFQIAHGFSPIQAALTTGGMQNMIVGNQQTSRQVLEVGASHEHVSRCNACLGATLKPSFIALSFS